MTFSAFLRLYGAVTIATMLVTWLQWPFAPIRRWLNRAAEINTDPAGRAWVVTREGQTITRQPHRTAAEAWAAANVGRSERARGWVRDLTSCPFCFAAHAAFWLLLGWGATVGTLDGLFWWPLLWLASSATVVAVQRVAEG